MWLRLVDEVVPPSEGLLNAKLAPLHLLHQPVTRHKSAEVLRQNHVTVFRVCVKVLVAVQDLGLHLGNQLLGILFLLRVRDGEEIHTLKRRR